MKLKKIFIPLLSCLLIGGIVSTSVVLIRKNDEPSNVDASYNGVVVNPFSKNIFYIGEEIEIGPKDISFDDHIYTCQDFYIMFPDGVKKTGTKHVLDQNGRYEITYIAETSVGIIQATEDIYAYKKAYSVTKDTSSCEYVDEIKCNQTKQGGIQVNLSEGDTWTYNQAIDISKASLETPIITYYTRQMSELADHVSLDVESTVIRITDFYDETNYVEIHNTYNCTNNSTGRLQPYVLAGANGQTPSGIDPTNRSSRTITYNNAIYYLHTGKAWGACLDTVPGAKGIFGQKYSPDIANSDNRGFSLFYDYANNAIYMRHDTTHIVTDLDEPAIYSNNLFKGFTTGEVIISLRCEGYKETHAFFEVSNIFGTKNRGLNKEFAYDENAPIITLSNNANNFYISKGEEFELFKATASDPHIRGDVTVEVYYDYGSPNERFVPINDGKFMASFVGKYTIIYKAIDTFGNVARKVVECNSITTTNNEIVSVDFSFVNEVNAGEIVTLDAPIVTGYNKDLFYKIAVYNDSKEDGALLDKDNLSFRVGRVGHYTIAVEYGDYSCSRTKYYEFNSLPSNNAYLETEYFPKYFIKDAMYTLDDNKAVFCNTEKYQLFNPKVKVIEDGNIADMHDIDAEKYYVNALNKVQFKYYFSDLNFFTSEEIPVVDVNFIEGIDQTAYFVGDVAKVASMSSIAIKTNASSGDSRIDFINPLSFDLFRMNLTFISTRGFDSFDLIMEDYYGISEDFVISFRFNGNILLATINGKTSEIGNINYLIMSYDSINKELSLGNGFAISLDSPFINDRFNLSFEYKGLTSQSEFEIKSINNQTLSNSNYDAFAPQIAYKRLAGQRKINSSVIVRESYCCDVFSPYLKKSHKMMVTYRENLESGVSFLTSTNGHLLNGNENPQDDYGLFLDKHGIYTITYKYADQSYSYGVMQENEVTVSEVIYVNDNECPEVIIDGATSLTIDAGNVNSEITVRNYVVKDGSNVNVAIYAVSPQNRVIRVNDMKFTPYMSGDWRIIYYAEDANNNCSSASYTIRVK